MAMKVSSLLGFAVFYAMAISPASAGSLTCEPGQEALCDEYCSHVGGGMSSNPDGSVTCTYAMKMRADAKYDQKVADANDWVIVWKGKSAK